MRLFNLEGSAIFGSGSEWFWSMLQFLVVAATLIGLYRQVRLQSSQTAVSQLSSLEVEWFAEPSTHYKLAVLTALRDGADPANLPRAAAQAIARMWEKIGILARQGHLDRRLLWKQPRHSLWLVVGDTRPIRTQGSIRDERPAGS